MNVATVAQRFSLSHSQLIGGGVERHRAGAAAARAARLTGETGGGKVKGRDPKDLLLLSAPLHPILAVKVRMSRVHETLLGDR